VCSRGQFNERAEGEGENPSIVANETELCTDIEVADTLGMRLRSAQPVADIDLFVGRHIHLNIGRVRKTELYRRMSGLKQM
jgi:hypothetical protein